MSAAAPNPNKIILLAAVGIGVYWFMSRRAVATPIVTAQTAAPGATAPVLGVVSKLLSGLFTASPNSAAAQASGAAVGATNAVSDGNYAGVDPNMWTTLSSSAVDGVAANPPVGTVFDTSAGFGYLSGFGSLGD